VLNAVSCRLKKLRETQFVKTLIQTGNHIGQAADLLGYSKSTLYRKIKEYKLLD
jgi:transcriptional regulator of acetoin/glycerol metabolism